MRLTCAAVLLMIALVPSSQGAVITFTDVTGSAFAVPPVLRGSAVALGDIESDGDLDLRAYTQISDDRLYRNDGAGHFEDITSVAGVSGEGDITLDGPFCDYDNDGLPDMFVSTAAQEDVFYKGLLFHSLDGLHYEQVATGQGVRQLLGTTGAAWGDLQEDGLPDLFAASQASFLFNTHPFLYLNRRGHFEDIWPSSGMVFTGGGASGAQIWFDYEEDGDPDLYHGCYGNANFDERDRLWRNEGQMHFSEVLDAISPEAVPTTSVQLADFDGDGLLDIFALNETWENYVWRNNGDGTYTDIAASLGLQLRSSPAGGALRKNGCVVEDLDNDMDPDVYIATSIPLIGGEPRDFLMMNEGGVFVDRAVAAGTVEPMNTWSCCAGDLNGDGFLDIYVGNDNDGGSRGTLWMNNGNTNHWLEIDPVGVNSNRDAFGLRASVTAGGVTQEQVLYCHPSHPSRLHFGLGSNTAAETVLLRWPSGHMEVYKDIAADQVFRPTEGDVVPLPPTGVTVR